MMRWGLVLTLSACVGQAPPPPVRLAADPPAPAASSGAIVTAPLRRLTRAQYHQSVIDLFTSLNWTDTPAARFPAEQPAGPFRTNSTSAFTPLEVDVAFAAAEELAARAAPRAETLAGCTPLTQDCALTSLQQLARRAWRRPVTAEETARFSALLEGGDVRRGYELGLVALLASPSFLQLVETGTPDGSRVRLTGHEVAGRLALLLRRSVPDDALLAAADDGSLDTPEGIARETWRLLRDDRAIEALADFHTQWLGLTGAVDKDPVRYPFFDDTARTALDEETRVFVDTVVRRSDGRLATLLTAPFTTMPAPLHRVYGVRQPRAGALVGLDPARRGGLLTQPHFLATHAHPRWTSPTLRGVVLTRDVLCLPLGAPPPDVPLDPVTADPLSAQTRRQRIEQHARDGRCVGCHQVIDPLGLAFERYDAVGAWRDVDLDDGRPLDTFVAIAVNDPELDGPVADATELVQRLAKSQRVRSCVATQWYRYALGRIEGDDDAPELQHLRARFAASDGSIPDLLVALTTSDAFRYRSAAP